MIQVVQNGNRVLLLNTDSLSDLSKKFLEACNHGNLPEVRECIEEGVDVNVQDEDGVSAAMIAMKNKNIEVLKILSEVDSLDWNLEDDEGQTLVFWYSFRYSTDFDEAFNELKNIESIDWNHQNKEGFTVSMHAACLRKGECLKMLSQMKNINWNLQDSKGCTTAMYAVEGGRRECVQIFSQIEGIDWNLQDEDGNTPLLAAARAHETSLKRLKNLLGRAITIIEDPIGTGQAKKIDYNNTALKSAAAWGKVRILQMLIQQPGINWDIENEEGDTALTLILRNEELFCIVFKSVKSHVSKLMTKKFGDGEITKTPVIFALENDLEEHIVKILVAGARTQDIVDLVLYSGLYSPTVTFVNEETNPSKKIKLDHS